MEIWLFQPASSSATYKVLRNSIFRECETRGWRFVPQLANKLRFPEGKQIVLIPGNAATALYRRIHVARVAIVAVEPSVVFKRALGDPERQRKDLIGLERFCRYKAFFVRRPKQTAPASWMNEFEKWSAQVHCSGERDPRCLPLHVFQTMGDFGGQLHTAAGREAFDSVHGQPNSRVDADRRCWRLDPHSYHGTESLNIAGCSMPTGMHWDVSSEERRSFTIHTTSEEWLVKKYVNVASNASVRATSRSEARRIFP